MSEDQHRPADVTTLVARFRASRAWRAWKRYADARGNVLAAGVGYFAFFSIFPAVALAFTMFGFVLQGRPELLLSIADQLNVSLPGLVRDARHPDGLIPITAPQPAELTISGVVALVVLLLAGLGWLGALREGIRAVFGQRGPVGNPITTKVRDLGVLLTLGLGIALSAVLTSAVGAASGWIAGWVGLPGQGWVLILGGFMVSVLVDTGLMMVLLRVLSAVPVPWRDLSQGALLGGFGFSLLELSAAWLLPRVTDNPLFASIAIVVGLLFWLNLVARLTLISAAWAANDVDEVHASAEVLAKPSTAVVRDGSLPTFGARSGDRTTLAAGAVLGAVLGALAVSVTGAVTRVIRSVAGLARR